MVVGTMPAGVCQELRDITLSTGKHHNNYIINNTSTKEAAHEITTPETGYHLLQG